MAKYAPTVERMTEAVFLVVGHDAEGSEAIREQYLDAHLEYVEQHCNDYLICGPLKPPGEVTLCASYFLLAAADEHAARALVSGDPYVQNGVYARLDVQEAVASAGRWLGGVIWESGDSIRAAREAQK